MATKAIDPRLKLPLAEKMRAALKSRTSITEKAMFGGICFLLRGNMLCAVSKDRFMFRVGKEQDAEALARPGATPMGFKGRRFPGFVWVRSDACGGRALGGWIALAENYVRKMPAKAKRVSSRRKSPRG